MSRKTYTVKPPVWTRTTDGGWRADMWPFFACVSLLPGTKFVSFVVEFTDGDKFLWTREGTRNTEDEGKIAAEDAWEDAVSEFLNEVM